MRAKVNMRHLTQEQRDIAHPRVDAMPKKAIENMCPFECCRSDVGRTAGVRVLLEKFALALTHPMARQKPTLLEWVLDNQVVLTQRCLVARHGHCEGLQQELVAEVLPMKLKSASFQFTPPFELTLVPKMLDDGSEQVVADVQSETAFACHLLALSEADASWKINILEYSTDAQHEMALADFHVILKHAVDLVLLQEQRKTQEAERAETKHALRALNLALTTDGSVPPTTRRGQRTRHHQRSPFHVGKSRRHDSSGSEDTHSNTEESDLDTEADTRMQEDWVQALQVVEDLVPPQQNPQGSHPPLRAEASNQASPTNHAHPARAPAALARSSREEVWGPFALARVFSKGIWIGMGATCYIHQTPGVHTACKKQVRMPRYATEADMRLRLKRWLKAGEHLPVGARDEHVRMGGVFLCDFAEGESEESLDAWAANLISRD